MPKEYVSSAKLKCPGDSGQGPVEPAPAGLSVLSILTALLNLDVFLTLVKGLQGLPWEQALGILKGFGETALQMEKGVLSGELLNLVPPPLQSLVGVVQTGMDFYQAGMEVVQGATRVKASIDFLQNGLDGEYADRGYSEDETRLQLSDASVKCNPIVLEALGAYPGDGRK